MNKTKTEQCHSLQVYCLKFTIPKNENKAKSTEKQHINQIRTNTSLLVKNASKTIS